MTGARGDGPAARLRAAAPGWARFDIESPLGLTLRVVFAGAYVFSGLRSTPPAYRGLAAVLIAGAIVGAGYAVAVRHRSPWQVVAGLGVAAATGDLLYALVPRSIGWIVSFAVVPWALGRLPSRWAVTFAAAAVGALGLVALLRDSPSSALGLVGGCLGFAMIGISSRAARRRAEDAERLLASELATREANARTHVLAERQRVAREIHDILAHTLSAQVLQLENARLLLDRGAPAETVRAQIDQAQRLARDGLTETKRALYSLRGDARPVRETLARLAEQAGAAFTADGDGRPVEPEARLALERTVQEALTNARKHAPGAAVRVAFRSGPDGHEVEVRDDGAREVPTLTGTGGGYGLTGMRERAELLGGRLEAGPDGSGYRVWLWIPA